MKWITEAEEDVSDELMIQSPPTHTGSAIEGLPTLLCEVGRT